MNGTNLHEYATCLSIHRQQSRHGNHQMTSLKINKALNIRTIANYVKEGGGGEVKSFDSFSQPLPPKIVSATLVLRRNIEGIPIQSLVSWEGMVRSESENTNCVVISCCLKL